MPRTPNPTRARRLSGSRPASPPTATGSAPRQLSPKLARLFATLDRHAGPIKVDILKNALSDTPLTRADLGAFAAFGRDCYTRNLIHTGPAYQALALCWRSGQRSPIHDHRGSGCALKVITGIATEVQFERSPSGLISPTGISRLAAGGIAASVDNDMHQMGNLEPVGCDLITLHIYSPPLRTMGTYFLGDSVIGEHEIPAHAIAVARTSTHLESRDRLIAAIRRTRARIQPGLAARKRAPIRAANR